MTTIEIIKELHRIVLCEEGDSIEKEIANSAIDTLSPHLHLEELYGNKNLILEFDVEFFILHVEQIVYVIENRQGELSDEESNCDVDDYTYKLAFLAYQLVLQEMLLKFKLITDEEILY